MRRPTIKAPGFAGDIYLAAQVIRQSRNLGIALPFIGMRELDSPEFLNIVGDAGVDMLTAGLRGEGYQLRRFAERFKKRFPDAVVDASAAIGYDCVRVYAEAVASANSADPALIDLALHYKLSLW